ncbi:PREDICTED: polymeric immunoglobulin receptor-like [Pygoscelis adeliae]|uniref:polymeric immunoglobulin receptor-like n=1 Tax=Pygoscelis adeliae TaxID=9238 RepID=UPI0004F4F823|nr:PREDICTED: polymeric immunoglobulin receptor-like [Pygoscelis adeliae]
MVVLFLLAALLQDRIVRADGGLGNPVRGIEGFPICVVAKGQRLYAVSYPQADNVALKEEPVSSTLYGARFLTGEVGGSVTHQCFYSIMPANKHDRKYWCKIAGSGVCYTIISTTGYTSKDHAGRVSLEDIPQNGTFMVTMTELKKSDTGTYRCGIGTTNRDLYVSLNLTVLADAGALRLTELIQGELRGSVTVLCPPGDTQGGEKRFWCKLGRTSCALIADTNGYVGKRPKFLSGTVGGSLSLKCHYDPKGNYEKKYLCRWKEASCSLLVDVDGFVHESYKGRIQIASNDQENGIYTVVMSHLREEDAGWYWCGAKNRHTEHTSSVKLRIQKATYSTPTQRSITGLMYVMGTVTKSTSTLLPTAPPSTFVTSASEIYRKRQQIQQQVFFESKKELELFYQQLDEILLQHLKQRLLIAE